MDKKTCWLSEPLEDLLNGKNSAFSQHQLSLMASTKEGWQDKNRAGPPMVRWCPEDTPSIFTSASTEWVLRSMTLGHWEEAEICHEGDGELTRACWHQFTKSSLGQRNKDVPHSCTCSCQRTYWRCRFNKQALYAGIYCVTICPFLKSRNSYCGWELTPWCMNRL